MVCRLCLIESDKSIIIFSEENIQKYIMKFFQLELTPEDPVSKVICSQCWQQLDDFQNFCIRVEEAQKKLTEVRETTIREELKEEEVGQNESEEPSREDLSFERVDTDSSFNLLKEEEPADVSHDDNHDSSDTFPYVDEEFVKVELHNEETASTISPATSDQPSTRRVTRGLKLKTQATPEVEVYPDVKAKRKSGRPKKLKVEEQQKPEPGEEVNVSEKMDKDEEVEKAEESKKQIVPDINKNRKRGRPKKGEVRPKVKKVRSEKCEKILETAKEFDEIIQKNMNLNCNICGVHLIDFTELKRHFRAIHNRKGYAVCCNKRLYKRGLVVDHINKHNNPDYFKCKDCGKVMADRMCLRNHVLLMHQKEDDKMYQCSYCPKKYAKQYLLEHHRIKHIPKEECKFICAECERGFPTKTTLTKHLNQIHSTLYAKMCEICAKLIRGNAAFERHMDEHEGIVRPQVQCEICGSWLKDNNSLRKHMYKHDGKSYSCNECGKVAPSKSALESHRRYVHQTSRQFHCSFCEKSFKKAVSLREHMTTHTGEVLYTCPHCPKTFNSKANMHAHRKKKHREEWEANRRFNVKQVKTPGTNSVLS